MARTVYRGLALALALASCNRPGLLPEGPQLELSARALGFQASGGYDPAPAQLEVRRSGMPAVVTGLSVDYGSGPAGWLSVAWSDPSASPVTLTVRPHAASLPSGNHRATVWVAAEGAANSPQAVEVSVEVPEPRLVSSLSRLDISAPEDGSDPAPVVFWVGNGGGGVLPKPTVTLDDGPGHQPTWLSAEVSGSAAPYQVTVRATDPRSGAQPPFAQMTLSATGQTQGVGVRLWTAQPRVGLSRESLVFAYQPGQAAPEPQAIQISNAGGQTLATPMIGSPSWLTASVSGTSAPYTLTVAPVAAELVTLAAGTHTGDVWVSAADGAFPRAVSVRLEVGTPPPPAWTSMPRTLSFQALAGDPDPAPRSTQVTGTPGAAASGTPAIDVSASGGGPALWLSAALQGAVEPFTLAVQPHLAGLAPGVYSATVSIASPGSSSRETVLVELEVAAWRQLRASATCARSDLAIVLPGGRVLTTGAAETHSAVPCASIFSPTDGSAVVAVAPRTTQHTATLLADGRVLVAGGWSAAEGRDTGAWQVYDPGAGLWLDGPIPASPRRKHVAALLPDGRVLVAGGWNSFEVLASADVIDPVTGLSFPAASPGVARAVASSVVLADGRVLIAGGSDKGGAPLSSAEIFDPRSGGWSETGAMGAARIGPALVLLADGRVLAAGGVGGTSPPGPLASAEIFDPATGTWTATGAMAFPRATRGQRLPSGRVLLVGGGPSPSNLGSGTAESFDPATGTWSGAGTLPVAYVTSLGPGGLPPVLVTGHSPALLPDGRVLVMGGCGNVDCKLSNSDHPLIGRGVAP